MENQYLPNEIPDEIPRPVLRYAIKNTPGFRGIAEAIKDNDYYNSVYNKRRGDFSTVEKSLIQPLINHSEVFAAAIKEGLSLYLQEIDESVVGSSTTIMEGIERAMLILHGVHQKLMDIRKKGALSDVDKSRKP